MNVWQEEAARLAAASEEARAAAIDAVKRHAAAIGLDDAAASRMVAMIVDGIEVEESTLDEWTLANDNYRASALQRILPRVEGQYLDLDPSLDRIDGAPFDPTYTRPRIRTANGIEVRGSRRGYVIGSGIDGTDSDLPGLAAKRAARVAGHYRIDPMRYEDCRVIADAYLRSSMPIERFIEGFRLIGTDEYSWRQVVAHDPIEVEVGDGKRFIERPEGAGHSIAGTARHPVRFPMRRSSAHRFTLRVPIGTEVTANGTEVTITEPWIIAGAPIEVYPAGAGIDAPYRIRKVYATVIDGGTIVPRRGWAKTPRRSTSIPSTRKSDKYLRDLAWRNAANGIEGTEVEVEVTVDRATRRRIRPVEVASVEVAVEHAVEVAAAAFGTSTEVTVKYRTIDGTTVTMTHEASRKRYRVEVAHRYGDGATVRRTSTVRSAAAVGTSTARLASSVRPR